MKTTAKTLNGFMTIRNAKYLLMTVALMFFFTIQSLAGTKSLKPTLANFIDTSVSEAIKSQILAHHKELYFPHSVERFYYGNGFKLIWIAPDTMNTHASEAMLLLDCVLHYGLNHQDYHPQELLYERLKSMTAMGNSVSDTEKARFDMMLTDAMIAFMNHLHYGKLNPDFPSAKIDTDDAVLFQAGLTLKSALNQKNFMGTVEAAQPTTKEYINLQNHMRLLTGQYQEDCYEVPQEDIRKMAINLERLRWINTNDTTYLEINIPAYTLTFHQPDTVFQFKVIVGTPGNPTPTLQSTINYFNTAPDWKVPKKIFIKEILPKALKDPAYLENNHFAIYDRKGNYVQISKNKLIQIKQEAGKYSLRQAPGCDNALGLIVFRFPNIFDIYLHDTPEQLLFAKEDRDLSHGCIRVEHAEKLAVLLLKNDGAADKAPALVHALEIYQKKTFTLKKSVPIKVTYLTCEVKEGLLITYKDIYDLDKILEFALYNTEKGTTIR